MAKTVHIHIEALDVDVDEGTRFDGRHGYVVVDLTDQSEAGGGLTQMPGLNIAIALHVLAQYAKETYGIDPVKTIQRHWPIRLNIQGPKPKGSGEN